ncbi:MAG: NAD(P)H-dependent oxidoreductase [Candidatus Shapirobacteria bacterium]|nr:NAD(P)H-dependent oxidoreductase [Candidatus Shapirobacteria bacterium]
MKILIAYFSKNGHTKRVANDLAKNLKADIEEIVDLKDRRGLKGWLESGRDGMKGYLTEIREIEKKPKNYDLVIVGTPVWGWNSTPAARTYIANNKDDFKNLAVFITSGDTKPEKTVASLETVLNGNKVLTFEGWSEKELKDEKIYREKLERFITNTTKKNIF